MRGYLLDTNFLSELLRKHPSEVVLRRLRKVPQAELFVSAVSVMELRFGAARHPRGEDLWARIRAQLLVHLKILGIGAEEAIKAGEILAELEASGKPIGVEDVLIGATALVSDLTVATRNIRHFSLIPGLRVEDWWRE